MLSTAAALVIGLHAYTHHANKAMDDNTPGIYAVAPGVGVLGGSLTAGAYRNSIGRPSVYVGQTWEYGRYGLTVAAVTGYTIKTRYGQDVCRPGYISVPENPCRLDSAGHTRHLLAPLVAPSISFPEAVPYIGVAPRLSLVGLKGGAAVHLSLEWQWGLK